MDWFIQFVYNAAATIGLIVIGLGSVSVIVSWTFRLLMEKWLNSKWRKGSLIINTSNKKNLRI
jgi:hypothetical protein